MDFLAEYYDLDKAREYSEGCEALYNLLSYCVEHKIPTKACCSGHFYMNEEECFKCHYPLEAISKEEYEKKHNIKFLIDKNHSSPYISFPIKNHVNNLSDNFARFICSNPFFQNDEVLTTFVYFNNLLFISFYCNMPSDVSKVDFKEMQINYFDSILNICKEYNPKKLYESAKFDFMNKLAKDYLNFYQITFCGQNIDEIILSSGQEINMPMLELIKLKGYCKFNNTNNVSASKIMDCLKKELEKENSHNL